MADFMKCPSCGATDQEVGKFCEQCGSKVEPVAAVGVDADAASPAAPADSAVQGNGGIAATAGGAVQGAGGGAATDVGGAVQGAGGGAATDVGGAVQGDGGVAADVGSTGEPNPAGKAASDDPLAPLRFIRLENGIFNREHAFDVPVGSRLLVGRTDPVNGVFPEVDVTMWSARVATPEGSLYTIHRKQCTISRDEKGRVWIVDYPDYEGDTMVAAHGSSQFRTIPSLSDERDFNDEGAVALEVGDRILMGQGEGMLIFTLVQL